MLRPACVKAPLFRLQVLFRKHPEWKSLPVVAVEQDKPAGIILEINPLARKHGIEEGMKYATALALAPNLQAGSPLPGEIEDDSEAVKRLLLQFSPELESIPDDPTTFWVNAAGMQTLYPTLAAWAAALRQEASEHGFYLCVVIGFRKIGTYIALQNSLQHTTRSKPQNQSSTGCRNSRETAPETGVRIFSDLQEEKEAVESASVAALPIGRNARRQLEALGVTTVGNFLRLPPGGLRIHYGKEVERVYWFAKGGKENPFTPEKRVELPLLERSLLYPAQTLALLHPHIEELLTELLSRTRAARQFLSELLLLLFFEETAHMPQEERIRPAQPTRNKTLWLKLIRLRLERKHFPGRVVRLVLLGGWAAETREQIELFHTGTKRDPAAAADAFAQVRAELGDDVFHVAELSPNHLPEAQFRWIPVYTPSIPEKDSTREENAGREKKNSGPPAHNVIIRRIFPHPRPFPALKKYLSRGTLHIYGPFMLSGGWWVRQNRRDYYFAESSSKEVVWIYFDRTRKQWMLHGFLD